MNGPFGGLAAGTWSWGDRSGWGAGYTEQDAEKAFQAAVRGGIRLFDTAERYGAGDSERMLGRFIAGTTETILVATKFSPFRSQWRPKHLRTSLEGSLKRLGRSRIDLYQIHWPTRLSSIGIWMEALADAAAEGLVAAAGVCNFSEEEIRSAQEILGKRGMRLASVQAEFSILQRAPERNGVLAACRELGVPLLAYSPLGMGVLTGKYDSGELPPGRNRERITRARLESLKPLTGLMRDIGRGHGKTPAQVALNWVIASGAIPIAGVRNGAQASEDAGALGWSLSAEEVRALGEEGDKVNMVASLRSQ